MHKGRRSMGATAASMLNDAGGVSVLRASFTRLDMSHCYSSLHKVNVRH